MEGRGLGFEGTVQLGARGLGTMALYSPVAKASSQRHAALHPPSSCSPTLWLWSSFRALSSEDGTAVIQQPKSETWRSSGPLPVPSLSVCLLNSHIDPLLVSLLPPPSSKFPHLLPGQLQESPLLLPLLSADIHFSQKPTGSQPF